MIRGTFTYTSTKAAISEQTFGNVRRVLLRGAMVVEANGDMSVFVHGKGKVTLIGEGSYRVKGERVKEINGFASIELK